MIREQIANPYRGLGLSMLMDLSTNSKPLPGLILRLLNLTPIRRVGASFVRMTASGLFTKPSTMNKSV